MAAPTIRRATPSDFPQISSLLHRYSTEWDIWQRDPPEKILADLHHPTLGFFLAEVDATPAGCVLVRDLPTLPGAAECKRLYVSPEFRGHRLATLLMDAAESATRAAGLDWMYLDSKDEFATAIALYRSRGYHNTARYNDNAQATLFLRKPLTT